MTDVATILERGRAAYARREWGDAFAALSEADRAVPLGVEDLELMAYSAGLTGRDDELLRTQERLYQAEADAGRCEKAARWAFWIGFRLVGLGEVGRANGWLSRAERLVERVGEECVVHGYLLLPLCSRHLIAGEYEAAEKAALRASAIGERFQDKDLYAFARSFEGRGQFRRRDRHRAGAPRPPRGDVRP